MNHNLGHVSCQEHSGVQWMVNYVHDPVTGLLISRKDQQASNGIVHIIDHPLDPAVFLARDVAQIVIQDGRFSKMAGAMQRCGFLPRLRESGKSYTLLAPSDEAISENTTSEVGEDAEAIVPLVLVQARTRTRN